MGWVQSSSRVGSRSPKAYQGNSLIGSSSKSNISYSVQCLASSDWSDHWSQDSLSVIPSLQMRNFFVRASYWALRRVLIVWGSRGYQVATEHVHWLPLTAQSPSWAHMACRCFDMDAGFQVHVGISTFLQMFLRNSYSKEPWLWSSEMFGFSSRAKLSFHSFPLAKANSQQSPFDLYLVLRLCLL
jgi:hypothetical protein